MRPIALKITLAALAITALVSACSGGTTEEPPIPDAGTTVPDAGNTPDAGETPDAGDDCLGEDGCWKCAPTTTTQFLNACVGDEIERLQFDNAARLPLLLPDGGVPSLP